VTDDERIDALERRIEDLEARDDGEGIDIEFRELWKAVLFICTHQGIPSSYGAQLGDDSVLIPGGALE
jgi:hypothetical protein